MAAALAGPVRAGAPDWAKDVIEAAPPVPDGVPDWPERTLLDETRIVVDPDGASWRIEKRKVAQVLSARAEGMQFGFFAFDDTTKIKKSKGWQIAPGESAHRNFGGALDLNVSSEFLTDAKQRAIALGDVKRGSFLIYDFLVERRPYTSTTHEIFFDGVPIALERVALELPPGWDLKYQWIPEGGPEPTREGATWLFERRDLAPAHEEPLDDDPVVVAPRLVLAPQPPAGLASAAPTFADWDALARWYAQLNKDRAAPTPEIEAAAKAAVSKAGPAPLDKIRAVTLVVRDRVRYIAREMGIGGYQAHAAGSVIADGHGDCKDKATLLRASLATVGLTSYPMLINATNPNTVARGVPTPQSFDHVVLGVVWPKDAPFPDEAASSRVDAGDAGVLLVVDPTDEYAWPGALPPNLAGKTAVVVAEAHGVLVTLPEAEARWHRTVIQADASAQADRSMALTLDTRLYGGAAEAARRENARSYKDRRESVEAGLRRAWAGAEIKDYRVTAEDTDGAYATNVVMTIPAGSPALQDDVYWLFANASGALERIALGKRKTTVRFEYPRQIRYETSLTGAPKSYVPPAGVKLSGPSWAIESSYRSDDGTLHAAWQADLLRARFDPDSFPELKHFWEAASEAAGTGVKLIP